MPNASDIFSAEISRAMDFLAVVNGGVGPILEALDSADGEIEDIVASLLRRPRQPFPKAAILAANRTSVRAAFKAMEAFGYEVAQEEAAHAFEANGGEAEGLKALSKAEIREVLRSLKFMGQTVAEHRSTLAKFRVELLLDELGTLQQARKAGAMIDPGVALKSLARGRQAMESTVRVYVPAVREAIRKRFYRRNPKAVGVFYWSAILDSHTTDICLANDGATRKPGDKAWSNGYTGAYPAHYGERSVILNLPASAARQLKARQSAEEWLDSQSEAEQRKILGPARYRLWKTGKISLRDFISSRGRTLTLSELSRRHPGAARKAGVA